MDDDEAWQKLKLRLCKNRAAILAEVENATAEAEKHRPSPEQFAEFREYVKRAQAMEPLTPGPFPTAEAMIREGRGR